MGKLSRSESIFETFLTINHTDIKCFVINKYYGLSRNEEFSFFQDYKSESEIKYHYLRENASNKRIGRDKIRGNDIRNRS